MSNEKYFDEILDSIENDDMWKFAEALITTIPEYVLNVAASSTSKYHPTYALGDGGLVRHTCAVVRILNHFFEVECMNHWSSRERDMLRIAGMMHDSRKSGSQQDYEKNRFTKHEHPLLAAEVVRNFKGHAPIADEEVELIAQTIETHMGQWNTSQYSDVVLPKPTTEMQKLLHTADYLASRKDIEIKFEHTPKVTQATWTFTFGKYKGKTFNEVLNTDKDYLIWLRDKATMEIWEPLKTYLKEMR